MFISHSANWLEDLMHLFTQVSMSVMCCMHKCDPSVHVYGPDAGFRYLLGLFSTLSFETRSLTEHSAYPLARLAVHQAPKGLILCFTMVIFFLEVPGIQTLVLMVSSLSIYPEQFVHSYSWISLMLLTFYVFSLGKVLFFLRFTETGSAKAQNGLEFI